LLNDYSRRLGPKPRPAFLPTSFFASTTKNLASAACGYLQGITVDLDHNSALKNEMCYAQIQNIDNCQLAFAERSLWD
jgi:hypothetical protein